jgi:hypothetical protein
LRHRGLSEGAQEKLSTAIDFVRDFGERGSSPFNALRGVTKRLMPYEPGLVQDALTQPGFASSAQGISHPGLARVSELQSGLSSVSRFLERGVEAADRRTRGPQVQTSGFDPSRLGVNALKDLVNLPAQVIPSTYLPASTAASGDVAGAARMLADPYVALAKDPLRSFEEHPLNNALLVYGPARGASRGVGRIGRRAGIEAFSTERAPLRVPGTRLEIRREYNTDPVVKGIQVLRERSARRQMASQNRRADALEAQALREGDRPDLESRALRVRDEAARRDPNRASDNQVAKLYDEFEGTAQGVQASHRDEVVIPTQRMLREVGAAGHAISPLAQGFVRPTVEGLREYRASLVQQAKTLVDSPSEQAANRALRIGLDKAIQRAERGDFDPAQVRQIVEREYRPIVEGLEKKLNAYQILPSARAERAKLIPPAARLGMRDAPSEAIRARMREEGLPDPIFQTQAPNRRGAGNFYRHFSNPGSIGRQGRTGQATIKGTFDADPETLVEQVSRMQGLVDAHENYGRFLTEFGYTKHGARDKFSSFETKAQAERARDVLDAQAGSPKWQVVRVTPFKGKESTSQAVLDGVTPETDAALSISEVLEAAVRGDDGPGKFALVPAAAAKRMREHLGVLGPSSGGKLWRLMTGQWRKNVLATSPSWLAGQALEGNLRRLILTRPGDKRLAKQVSEQMRGLDPEGALRLEVAARPGGVYGLARRTVRTAADQFQDASPALAQLARASGALMQMRGPKQAAKGWNAYTQFVFSRLNEALERGPQQSMQGAYLRRRFDLGSGLRVSETAIRQAAEGMRGTPEQVAMARFIRRGYGQYANWSPAVRRAAMLYTPFASWAINATRFLYHVLPADHPVLTGLLADTSLAAEEWRKEHGLDLFTEDLRPDFLQGAIPLPDGRSLRWPNQYLPFSFASDPARKGAETLLPQLSGLISAFEDGEDWKGKKLRNSDGSDFDPLQKLAYGVLMFGQGMIPTGTKVGSVLQGEGAPQERLAQAFNPFKITGERKGSGTGPVIRVPTVRVPTVRLPTISP